MGQGGGTCLAPEGEGGECGRSQRQAPLPPSLRLPLRTTPGLSLLWRTAGQSESGVFCPGARPGRGTCGPHRSPPSPLPPHTFLHASPARFPCAHPLQRPLRAHTQLSAPPRTPTLPPPHPHPTPYTHILATSLPRRRSTLPFSLLPPRPGESSTRTLSRSTPRHPRSPTAWWTPSRTSASWRWRRVSAFMLTTVWEVGGGWVGGWVGE